MASIALQISKVSLELALSWCAQWVAKLESPTTSHEDVDREFVDVHFRGVLRSRILALLRQPKRVLLNPQTFSVMMKIALEHCRREGPPPSEADVSPLAKAVLAVPTHLSHDVEDLTEPELVVDVDGGRMAQYMVANQMFNNPADWRTAWAVYYRCLREIPRELGNHSRVIDFEAAYLDATAVPLDDLITVCAVLWARAINDNPTLPLDYFEPLRWEPARLAAVLDLIAASPEFLREALREDASELGLLWSTKTFDQFPVVRWENYLTVLRPSWIVNRSTGAWPLYDVRRVLEARGASSEISRVSGSIEHAYEHYTLEVLEDLARPGLVYRDDAIRRAYGKKSSVADAAFAYGPAWVVVEVSARGFQLKTAAGVSEEALTQDLDHVIRKARQAEATIDNIRRDEKALTGATTPLGARRFFPVVVVASRFAGNPITFTMLNARLRATGVLQAADCAPLEVFELEDLLAVEGACERHGYSFLDLLAEKSSVERPLVPMREFLAHKLGQPAPVPTRVDRAWPEWLNTAIRLLREGAATDDTGAE